MGMLPQIMENQMKRKTEYEMETEVHIGLMQAHLGSHRLAWHWATSLRTSINKKA